MLSVLPEANASGIWYVANIQQGDFPMLRISALLAVLSFAGLIAFNIAPAHAQKASGAKSCSLEACVATCQQRGTVRTCDRYCQNEMARRGCR
jgi:hypothetical protein